MEEDTQRYSQPVLRTVAGTGARGIAVVFPRSCGKSVAEPGTRSGIAMLLYHALTKSHGLPGESSVKL